MFVHASFLNVLLLCVFRYVCSSCVFENGKYDLSTLDRPSGWPVPGITKNGTLSHYEISICKPLNYSSSSLKQKGCSRSSVCLVSETSAVSYGNAVENASTYAFAANRESGFSLYILTNSICKNDGIYRSLISFACGPHLGVPELILGSDCQAHFFWRTSAACAIKPKNHQVPCYVLDEKGNVRNLSPLIKDDGYFVYTPNPSFDFVINVCSDLSLNTSHVNCPNNVSACRISGKEYDSFGSVSEGLKYTPDGLLLTYKHSDSMPFPSSCPLKPKTTIFFKCPARGYNQPPRLVLYSNCQYFVEWETEYACPENILKGDFKTCQFTKESHGVAIDLSPLSKKQYRVNETDHTYFVLSVCSGLKNMTCGGTTWKSISVCAFNSSGASEVIGTTDSAELFYADGTISLRYLKDEACQGFQKMSVINFICNSSASDDSLPRFVASHNCTNIFEWHTKHACLTNPLDIPCSVTFDKKTVNLQKLLLLEGEPWEAIDVRTSRGNSQAEYFINVCGQISKLGNHTKCGEDSSVCVLNDLGEYLSLGNFNSPPRYDPESDSVRLHYTGGNSCGTNKFWQSSINFICTPGQINSKPILTRINQTNCHYEFEWQTAEACPTGFIEGSNCKVFDSNLGINYDLTPLKSKVYKVDTPLYEFYLGVCEPVKDSPCTSNAESAKNVGVCQVDKSNQTTLKTGEPTSRLLYMDGVVNLTYLSGDPYYDKNRTARVTIIIFVCDFEAGNGHPHFIEVEDYMFVFHWYTALVCPQYISPECVVYDPLSHNTYDLSGLVMTKRNWMTVMKEDDKERKIYLNVCRSLTLPIGCDPNAAACLVELQENGEEKVIVSNLGRAVNPPVFQSPGHITLTYTNGDTCKSFGENTTYSSQINFLCVEEVSSQPGFSFLGKVGACEYTFLWATKAACPSEKLQSVNSCQLTDPESGFTFDLMPLHRTKEPYSIQSRGGGSFQFNICGKVIEGCLLSNGSRQSKNVSVCEVDNKGILKSNIAVSNSYILNYSPSTDLTLTYASASKGSSEEVVIKFPCSNNSIASDPKYMHFEDGQYVFEMKTSLTCIPEPVDCNIVDQFGHEYDFSPLSKYSDGNWEVFDSRPGFSHLKYHINFCKPLNKVTTYKCPGGSSSACQTNLNTEDMGYDLGSQLTEPVINENGAVLIHYSNGSPCHNGEFKRSTTISLACSMEESELRFLGETPECEYVFSLDTPVACPLESNQGKNCFVRDPLFGYTFNLNPLKNKHSNYNVTVGDYTYVFNVCDKLNGIKNKCANSSACQLKPENADFSKSLGLPSDVLFYRKGLITLEYKSGSGNCHGKYNRSTKITFTCHHAHEDKDGPFFISEAQDCTYLFEWPTVHACPPFDVIECSVVDDKGLYYDLSRLSLPNDNYYIKYPFSNKTFVINVCRSVVHTPSSLCPYTSAACLVDSSSKVEPSNLGVAYHEPYFDNGKIKINYTSGDPCDESDSPSARFLQTIIEFSCGPLIDSEPEYIGKDECTYYFDWHTAYACPPSNIGSGSDCTVKDPFTGYVFNFTSLKNRGLFKLKNGGHQYLLSVCGGDSSNACGPSAGMCQEELSGEKRHWSGGTWNTNITYDSGVLILNYTDGDSCHNGKYKRNTLIEFQCGNGFDGPQFLYESHDCSYTFSWKTELACQTLWHCAIKNGTYFYDLTALAESYHTAITSNTNDTGFYYISICNSLAEIPDVHCPPGAAVCKVSLDSQTSSTITESLGRVEYPPFIDFMGHPTVIFTNGSTCLKNPDQQNRARIIFLCDPDAGMGEPIHLSTSDECFYLFEWRTSLTCLNNPEVPPPFTSCNYTDNSRGIHFDLLPLQKTGTKSYYEVSGSQTMTFKLNVCAAVQGLNITKCGGAGVCGTTGNVAYNYGVAKSQKFTYSGGRLRLLFYDGDDCPSGRSGKQTSEIFFVCDPTAGLGEPVIHKMYTCLVVFLWRTSLVCSNMQRQCAFDINGHHYDFNLHSSLSNNWLSSDKNNNTYWINICRGVQPTVDTLGCLPTSTVCMVDNKGLHLSLGLIHTMKIKSEKNSTDLILIFDNGDSSACPSLNSTRSLSAVTRLFMRCGRSLGQPRWFSGPDSQCYYDFVWESSLACTNITEEIMVEKDGIIKDERLDFSFDINAILNKTFIVSGNSTNDYYVYKINLSGGVAQNTSDPKSTCAKAAICQTKPDGFFERDIGSSETRTFIVKGSELHLVLKSVTRPCGKNPSKDVTTIIIMQCSSVAGYGSPEFVYESGNCDYVFQWPTIVVCAGYHRKNHSSIDPKPNPYIDKDVPESSHHTAEIVVGIIFGIIAIMIIAFIVVKAERRAIISFRLRSLFGRVSLPYFRYKRCEGEKLVLVDASQTTYDDEEMLRC